MYGYPPPVQAVLAAEGANVGVRIWLGGEVT